MLHVVANRQHYNKPKHVLNISVVVSEKEAALNTTGGH